MGVEGGYNSPVFGEHFRAAISREMGQRRYRKTESPGLLVNVTIRADDQVKMTSYTAPYMSGAYYNRPGGAFYGSSLGLLWLQPRHGCFSQPASDKGHRNLGVY